MSSKEALLGKLEREEHATIYKWCMLIYPLFLKSYYLYLQKRKLRLRRVKGPPQGDTVVTELRLGPPDQRVTCILQTTHPIPSPVKA